MLSSWNFLTVKTHPKHTFSKSYRNITFQALTVETKLQNLPCRFWLESQVTFLKNSVIYKDVDLEFNIETNF